MLTDVSRVIFVGEFPPSRSPAVDVREPEEMEEAFDGEGAVASCVVEASSRSTLFIDGARDGTRDERCDVYELSDII